MNMFMPFIILLIIATVIIYSLRWLNRQRFAKKGYWLLGGYVLLLLLSVGVYYLIPVPQEDSEGEPEDIHTAKLQGVIYDGIPIESIRQYLDKEWEFPSNQESIHIGYQGNIDHSIQIAVERSGNTDSIEASFYQTPVYIMNTKITESLQPVNVEFFSGNLMVETPESMYLEFSTYAKEFPVKQFTGQLKDDWWDDVEISEQLLYLKVPENIEISSDSDVWIEYVK
ncbi:hypothetical protein ACFOUV_13670 [Oceanobacillus longus]|uniref:Uncharacterized protein n=1 Tax=Oceanobacillus longus TaxID=930120 RepID=A0ABV8H0Y0_9BACI